MAAVSEDAPTVLKSESENPDGGALISGPMVPKLSTGADEDTVTRSGDSENNARDSRYPLTVVYCPICTLPAEYHEYHTRTQFEKCKRWIRKNFPEFFPELFPEEIAAKLERIKLHGTESTNDYSSSRDARPVMEAVILKNSSGKKKKVAAEVIIALGQRKGRKQVTIVSGLDTFGVKLAHAAKMSKKKFATGSSVAKAADNRDVLEVQGSWQREFAELCHKQYGIPKNSIFVILPGKKKEKVKAFTD